MAQYVTGSGAVSNLPGNTRIAGSFTYGWLTQQDGAIFNEAGVEKGATDLSASTASGYLSVVSRPCDPLTLRFAYRVYDFENDNLNNPEALLMWSTGGFGGTAIPLALIRQEQYSYLRQSFTVGADYKINSKVTADVEYTYDTTDRNEDLGTTTSNTPKVGVRLYPCDWLNLIADYAHLSRVGDDFLTAGAGGVPLTYKFYAGDDQRNIVNFIAEIIPSLDKVPLSNMTFSVNFNLYDDKYSGSEFGMTGDNGWSAGADVGWTPCKGVSLAVGYSHEHANTNELASSYTAGVVTNGPVGDLGPVLLTSDQYDTVSARAEIVLIPDKLSLLSRASVSFSESDFHNPVIVNLDEFYFHVDTWLKYKLNKCTALKLGYIYERFDMTSAYQTLYDSTGPPNQSLNTLDGFYTNYTAHVVEALVQYKF